ANPVHIERGRAAYAIEIRSSRHLERKVAVKKSEISVALAALVVLVGCATSSQARKVTPSGFLGESASLLKKGGKDDVLLVYRNKNTDWATYDKIIVDPVMIWAKEKSTLPPDQLADYQRLVDDFYQTLKAKLSKDYAMTDTPGAGAMRLQVAIVNGD